MCSLGAEFGDSSRNSLRRRRVTRDMSRSCLLVVTAVAAWPLQVVAGAATATQTAAIACEGVAPVLFTPTPATLDLSLDVAPGADATSPPTTASRAPSTAAQDVTAQTTTNGSEKPSTFAVSFIAEPACEVPDGTAIRLAHSVPLAGPGNSTNSPIVTTSDLVFTEVVPFNGAIETLGTISVPGLKPGSWTGTLPLVFSVGPSDSPTVLGTASLPMTITNRQGWSEGFPFSPVVLLGAAILGGLVVGLYRMLSATENPDSIFVFRPSRVRPVGITWRWRNVAALLFGVAAGLTAWGGIYVRKPDFAVTWESSLALFAAVGGAALTAFVAAFAAPATSEEAVATARARLLEVDPNHGTAGTEVVVTGSNIESESLVFVGPTPAERVASGANDHSAKVKVPPAPAGAKDVVVSVVDPTTGERSDEVSFTYDS